jgi:hypothetical protein
MFYKLIVKSQKIIRLEHLLFTYFAISKCEKFLLKNFICTGRSEAGTLGFCHSGNKVANASGSREVAKVIRPGDPTHYNLELISEMEIWDA